ncbi:unnamed protein product [Laminaria digitata]
MAVLFLSEMLMFIKVDTISHMAVADFHDHDAVTARLHVTFPYIGCKGEDLEITDLEVVADHPLGGAGNTVAVAVDQRPASRVDRKPFPQKGGMSGCTLDGTVEVERAAGTIVVRVLNHDPARITLKGGFLGASKGEARTGPNKVAGQNVTHAIHDFGFGPPMSGSVGEGRNSLAGNKFVAEEGFGLVKYSLKVVPISHQRMYRAEVKTHTYSANVAFVGEAVVIKDVSAQTLLFGVEFSYDFNPVMVRYTDTRKSMLEFITSVCAIIGGVHTVSGLLVRGIQGVSRKKHD